MLTVTGPRTFEAVWADGTLERQAFIIGTPDGRILPSRNITRAESATIFFRLIDDATRTQYWSRTNNFTDVNSQDWFNNAVSTTTRMGLFEGTTTRTFAPEQNTTRAELVAAIVRFMELSQGTATIVPTSGINLFNDISGHWAREYINIAAAQGWIQGAQGLDGPFNPSAPITRAETAAMINRLTGRLQEQSVSLPNMRTWADKSNPAAWYFLYLQSASNSYTFEWGNNGYERWIEIIQPRNWAALERPYSTPQSIR